MDFRARITSQSTAEYADISPPIGSDQVTFRKTVLLTGGSQGLGKAVGQLLASKGANVIIVARNVQKLEAALQEISVHPFLARALLLS